MKHYYKGVWYNELTTRIKSNDLLNTLKYALEEYKKHNKRKPKK